MIRKWIALVLCSSCVAREPHVAPTVQWDIPVTTLDGRSVQLSTAVAHRPALLALWAPWCDACRSEEPALERLGRAAAPRGGVVIGVAVGEPFLSVRSDLGRHPRTFLQLVDEPFALEGSLGVHVLPTTLVLDQQGRIVHRGGTLDHAALAAFRGLLEDAE